MNHSLPGNFTVCNYMYSILGKGQLCFGVQHSESTSMFALYRGPEGTPFEGGVFTTRLVFPPDYPLSPPKMRFVGDMFHPNGKFC